MSEYGDGLAKATWERIIKEKMVPLNPAGSKSIYVLNDKKNSAVEIHFGTKYLVPPRQLSKMEPAVGAKYLVPPRQLSKMEPTVGRSRDTLDISSADFLIVNRNPAVKKCRQFIPWKKISEVVFLEA